MFKTKQELKYITSMSYAVPRSSVDFYPKAMGSHLVIFPLKIAFIRQVLEHLLCIRYSVAASEQGRHRPQLPILIRIGKGIGSVGFWVGPTSR